MSTFRNLKATKKSVWCTNDRIYKKNPLKFSWERNSYGWNEHVILLYGIRDDWFCKAPFSARTVCGADEQIVNDRNVFCLCRFGSHCKCVKHEKQVAAGLSDRVQPQCERGNLLRARYDYTRHKRSVFFFAALRLKHPPFWLRNPFTFQDSLMFFVSDFERADIAKNKTIILWPKINCVLVDLVFVCARKISNRNSHEGFVPKNHWFGEFVWFHRKEIIKSSMGFYSRS